MTEQSRNGPVDAAAFEATTLERAAELSTQMVRAQPLATTEITPQATAGELVKRLELIEEAMRTAMKKGIDYGVVPGTDKPGLFKPGAEKLAVLFKLDVQPRNELIWGPGQHLTVISRATVYHAPTGTRLGYGEGICSSQERNRAYRKQERTCPNCEQPAVIKGKEEYGGGYVCWHKKGGCGAKFPDGDQRIESQEVGEIENPDLPDQWNAVDKMAKKRAYVDATLSVTGASAIFTQDIGGDPSEAAAGGLDYGPVVAGELRQAATQAAISLCSGEPARAKALWEQIQAALDGYMPEAAAQTMLLAAQAAAAPAAGQQTTAPPAAAASAAASGQSQDPGPDVSQAGGPANGNAHGERLRVIAGTRGVGDADLANLIRNAVGQGPIPTDRARAALPTMLERISEEISQHTMGLIDMFYPSPEEAPRAASDGVTSVDFGAVEPPQHA